MSDDEGPDSQMWFMLRFTLSHPDLHTMIVGTANLDHLCEGLDALGRRAPTGGETHEETTRATGRGGGETRLGRQPASVSMTAGR